jgi:hypothetical protein
MDGMTTLPKWMSKCGTCGQLLAAVRAAELPLAESEALTGHLIDAHLAQVPAYDPECANCAEWAAIVGDPDGGLADTYGARVVPMLGREDLRHRAAHLVRSVAVPGRG